MTIHACRTWITVALVAWLGAGCSDESAQKTGAALESTGKDIAKTTKDVGNQIGDGLAEAADGLESFAQSLASDVSDAAADVGQKIQSKMPELESLVDQAKAQLSAGGAEAKAAAKTLDEKLAMLKTNLDQLAADGAQATKEMKDEVVNAFQDLVASIKSSLTKLKA